MTMSLKQALTDFHVRNRRHLIRGGLVLLGAVLVVVLVVRPVFQRTAREAGRFWEGNRQIAGARELIRRVPELESGNRKLSGIALYDMDASGERLSSKLLGAMVAAAQKSQIGFVSVRPMASLSRAGHFEIPVKIEVRAGYHQVGRFLSLLGSEGCVVKVEGFALAGDRTGAPIITASIDARAYFLKTGLGQERIGELLKVPKSERSPVIGINEYKAKHRDPFLPAGAAEAEVAQATGPAFRLKGIVWDEKKPLATIMDGSGAIYFLRQGEKIGTDLVLSIKPNSVTLRRANGARYELKTWE